MMAEDEDRLLIGVISDTHDLLRDSAVEALQGVDQILHIGDVCGPDILRRLAEIAPLHGVRGNMDHGSWVQKLLPNMEALEIGRCWIYMIHNLAEIDVDPVGRFRVVLHGHTHMPEVREQLGVLYFNPGSAGPYRENKPISLGFLEICDGVPEARWVEIA